jgi:integrase
VHPKIVSEMLGHSSIAITIDTYSHVIPGLGDFAASAMDAILNKTTGSKQQVASD